jgi:CHAT domain-containing protein/tetratricopeptide (TPR) repeat protein
MYCINFKKFVVRVKALKRLLQIKVILSLLAFLTIAISPVLSQTPAMQQISQGISDAQQLVQQGKGYYDAGRYSEAVKYLQQALKIFTNGKDELKQAITLSNLSLAYQQLGNWNQAQKSIEDSLKLLQKERKHLKVYAQSLNIQSHLYYLQGQPEKALHSSQQANNIYQQLGDESGIIGSRINSAQAMLALGLYQQAFGTLEEVKQNLEKIPDFSIKAKGFRSLGDVLRAMGDLQNSRQALKKSQEIAEKLNSLQDMNASLISLGNTVRALGNLERDRTTPRNYNNIPWQCEEQLLPDTALQFYQDAAIQYKQVLNTASTSTVRTQTQINYLSLLVESGQFAAAQALWREINLSDLPKGRQAVYAHINVAKNLACISEHNIIDNTPQWQEIDNLLLAAIDDATQLQDSRALSYALGNRGGFYEYLVASQPKLQQKSSYLTDINFRHSQQLTQQALLLAQSITAPDIAYQWEWQLGRIMASQGKDKEAVAFYSWAVESLDVVRNDLLAINSDVQFSYRDNVEPVYRGLVDLLLRPQENSQLSQDIIAQAIANIDALQLAELQNFLQCNLGQLLPIPREIDKNNNNQNIDANTAFIYPIILEDRLEVIYKLPGKRLEHYTQPIKRTKVQETVQQLRNAIFTRNVSKVRVKSQQVYDWLIKPLELYLKEQRDIRTLVFTLDGELRNIPMAVLYDKAKNEYLIQKDYALALLPSSQLFNLNPQPHEQLKVLAAGVSEKQENVGEATRNFNQLNIDELYQVAKLLPTKLLINEQFTQEKLSKQMREGEFPILHIATHGNFSSNPENTYLLAYKQLIKARDLNNLLRNNQVNSNTITLFVLSACQTAEGDHRAILGLAGLAVRAGASSTLSTLWQVNDDSVSQLMVQFYTEFQKAGVTKAEALHRAQKALMAQPEYQNPYFWAPYILVGNWR